jgi:molybdopterin/thiamine biosynthesis adenylyltransferase
MTSLDFSEEEIERYSRQILLPEIGGVGQAALRAARVLVVGAGGLGCPVLLYLAAAGVGVLGVVDDDIVELSNLQRQIAYRSADLGVPKVAAAMAAARAINPLVTLVPHACRLEADNAAALVAGYDVICDGSDNFPTRAALAAACFQAGKTLVTAAVSQCEGQLAMFRGGATPCYRCLYPVAPPADAANCAQTGVLGTVTGMIGAMQATEVLKEILGIGDSLTGRLLIWDALAVRFRVITLARDPACPLCGGREDLHGSLHWRAASDGEAN